MFKLTSWLVIRYFASSVFVPTKTQNSFPAVTPESCFCLLVAPPPNPFSQNFILWLRTVPALFLPLPAEIFRKRRGWLTSMIANCPIKGNGIFSKSVRLAEPQPAWNAVQRVWDASQQAKPAVSGIDGNRRFWAFVYTNALLATTAKAYQKWLNTIRFSGILGLVFSRQIGKSSFLEVALCCFTHFPPRRNGDNLAVQISLKYNSVECRQKRKWE